jgi:hypothetical protein
LFGRVHEAEDDGDLGEDDYGENDAVGGCSHRIVHGGFVKQTVDGSTFFVVNYKETPRCQPNGESFGNKSDLFKQN